MIFMVSWSHKYLYWHIRNQNLSPGSHECLQQQSSKCFQKMATLLWHEIGHQTSPVGRIHSLGPTTYLTIETIHPISLIILSISEAEWWITRPADTAFHRPVPRTWLKTKFRNSYSPFCMSIWTCLFISSNRGQCACLQSDAKSWLCIIFSLRLL